MARHLGETFPLGTMIVNVLGSFAIGAFLPVLEEMMSGGLVTVEKVHIVRYREGRP